MTSSRRSEILGAALACFVARGIEGATIADIRARAGATTGSIYHFFDGKDAIVAALYVDVLSDYHADLRADLVRHESARALVRGVVEQYLSWVERRRDAAWFLIHARRSAGMVQVEAAIERTTAATIGELRGRMKPWIDSGEIRSWPVDLYLPLLIGPAEAYARAWFAHKTRTPIARARTLLADAAWANLRGEE